MSPDLCFPFNVWVKSLSQVRLFVTPWTIAHQAPRSMGFSRQEYWSGLPFPSPGDLPHQGIEPRSPTLQADALTSAPPGRPRFNPWVGKIPWRRKWQPIPVLLPGKSHGQRSVVGCSPWGCKESDTTERLHFHFLSLSRKVKVLGTLGSVQKLKFGSHSFSSPRKWLFWVLPVALKITMFS